MSDVCLTHSAHVASNTTCSLSGGGCRCTPGGIRRFANNRSCGLHMSLPAVTTQTYHHTQTLPLSTLWASAGYSRQNTVCIHCEHLILTRGLQVLVSFAEPSNFRAKKKPGSERIRLYLQPQGLCSRFWCSVQDRAFYVRSLGICGYSASSGASQGLVVTVSAARDQSDACHSCRYRTTIISPVRWRLECKQRLATSQQAARSGNYVPEQKGSKRGCP
jgi:hypothetical protein